MPSPSRHGDSSHESDLPLRRVTLMLPDTRSEAVRRRIAEQSARLDPKHEREVMDWIEQVSIFDEPDRGPDRSE